MQNILEKPISRVEIAKEFFCIIASTIVLFLWVMCSICFLMGLMLFALQVYTLFKTTIDPDPFKLAICIAISIYSFKTLKFLSELHEKIDSQLPVYLRI